MRLLVVTAMAAMLLAGAAGSALGAKHGAEEQGEAVEYVEMTQGQLGAGGDDLNGAHVLVKGQFLFTGSDFCYQIRKTKINTRDYLCFALGPVSVVRFYMKKNHEQVAELMKMKKGTKLIAYGQFDSTGSDYRYVLVDRVEMVK